MEQQQNGSNESRMSRRNFIGGVAAAAAVGASVASKAEAAPRPGKFKLKYAPSFGAFEKSAGKDPIDQLKFMSDQGFRAMFDNRINRKPVDLQKKIAKENGVYVHQKMLVIFLLSDISLEESCIKNLMFRLVCSIAPGEGHQRKPGPVMRR